MTVITLLFWIGVIILIIRLVISRVRKNEEIESSIFTASGRRRDLTEESVEWDLSEAFYDEGYVIFGNLIIPSVSTSIKSTQIDHVIVSRYGIFCIETKSHRGNIYGGMKRSVWKQYLGPNNYELNSPVQQNNHHVKSLEYLLRAGLKAPIHSYIIFPYASKIMIDGSRQDMSVPNVINRIRNHQRIIYSIAEVEVIAKALAFVSDRSNDFEDEHVEAVRKFVTSKSSDNTLYNQKPD